MMMMISVNYQRTLNPKPDRISDDDDDFNNDEV
jgi:hypothetical protein